MMSISAVIVLFSLSGGCEMSSSVVIVLCSLSGGCVMSIICSNCAVFPLRWL